MAEIPANKFCTCDIFKNYFLSPPFFSLNPCWGWKSSILMWKSQFFKGTKEGFSLIWKHIHLFSHLHVLWKEEQNISPIRSTRRFLTDLKNSTGQVQQLRFILFIILHWKSNCLLSPAVLPFTYCSSLISRWLMFYILTKQERSQTQSAHSKSKNHTRPLQPVCDKHANIGAKP